MAASTLSETDTGTYIDSTGDIVLVFTDKDMNNKSLILQGDTERPFGSFAHSNDGYYDGDYSPYLPVRLFLPNIKRYDQTTYDIEEIEQSEQYDGAWIGDHGTLIIHRGESDPDRMLHVMFSYDTHDELKFVLYDFSPIFSSFSKTEKFCFINADERLSAVPVTHKETYVSDHTRETFHDRLDGLRNKIDDLQNQIDEMREHVSNALIPSTTAQANTYIITHRISTLEKENKPTSNAREIPDSEGFWRDIDGDIWVFDAEGTMRLISKGHKQDDNEIYNQSLNFSSDFNMRILGPYTKIDNPFLQGEDHAE